MTDDVPLDQVRGWLAARLGGPLELAARGRPGSGFSADNLIFTATVGERTTTHVLRVDSPHAQPYPEQSAGLGTGVALQSAVMQAVGRWAPVAPVLGVEHDAAVLGAPFLVMDFVDGVVPKETPPYTAEGFYLDADPELRTAMITHGLQALAAVHAVPWRDGELAVLDVATEAPGSARQLELWSSHLRKGLRGRGAHIFDTALDRLRSTLPAQPAAEDVVLLWGDARLGNIIWDPARGTVRALTDFEGAALGERELDLGWWLMADRWMHEGSGAARLAGEPTRAEQVAIYESAAGHLVAPLDWYELFAAYRFATTVVFVMNQWEQAGALPADHTIWRDNPATELIAAILADGAPS
ncbi:phosphotransferase family protein [Mycolicibacterium anyangense]|uniref:Phosphotransferase family protein n=1 Tax=Mycolicibacterium anyangense TaxID=1431246 RepID=A0A6N4W3Y1_9MYCO|nr:phosphotransferase family protein [Mycolicibacterium anyangense]BBZ75093.1 phosphotransferase family protein [Mycolicibacterium anyangense]